MKLFLCGQYASNNVNKFHISFCKFRIPTCLFSAYWIINQLTSKEMFKHHMRLLEEGCSNHQSAVIWEEGDG